MTTTLAITAGLSLFGCLAAMMQAGIRRPTRIGKHAAPIIR